MRIAPIGRPYFIEEKGRRRKGKERKSVFESIRDCEVILRSIMQERHSKTYVRERFSHGQYIGMAIFRHGSVSPERTRSSQTALRNRLVSDMTRSMKVYEERNAPESRRRSRELLLHRNVFEVLEETLLMLPKYLPRPVG